jgi:hypothetical protein
MNTFPTTFSASSMPLGQRIRQIEQVLGINPASDDDTIRERLDGIDTTINQRAVKSVSEYSSIQAAIDDVATTGGAVFIPKGRYTITSELILYPDVELYGEGFNTIIVCGADVTGIKINSATQHMTNIHVHDLTIEVSDGQTAPAIHFLSDNVNGNHLTYNNFENINISNPYTTYAYDGIRIQADVATGFYFNKFRNINICLRHDTNSDYGCNRGIHFDANIATSYLNGNSYENIAMWAPVVGVDFDHAGAGYTAGVGRVTFKDFQIQCRSITEYGFKNIRRKGINIYGAVIYDWEARCDRPRYRYLIHSEAIDTIIEPYNDIPDYNWNTVPEYIIVDDGSVFTNKTISDASYDLLPATAVQNDAFYIGHSMTGHPHKMNEIKFTLGTNAANITFAFEYYNGSAWATLTGVSDATTNLTGDGTISFTTPTDWATVSVNSVTAYWVRFRVSNVPVSPTSPAADQVVWRGRDGHIRDEGSRTQLRFPHIRHDRHHNLRVIAQGFGDYQTLAEAYADIDNAAENNRYTFIIYGEIIESAAKNVTFISQGAKTSYSSALIVNTADNCIITDCTFQNISTGATEAPGVWINSDQEDTEFIRCKGYGANIGAGSGGFLVTGIRQECGITFRECTGFGNTAGSPGWQFSLARNPLLISCRGEPGLSNNSYGFNISTGASPTLQSCIAEPPKEFYSWDYAVADSGRFRPFTGEPYQLVSIYVRVVVANVGETLDIGTAASGTQVASGIDIGSTGNKYFSFIRVTRTAADDANNYLYATPSNPINDGDIIIRIGVVYNHSNDSAFLAADASDALYIEDTSINSPNWRMTNCHLETYGTTSYAVIGESAVADISKYILNSSVIGNVSNVNFYSESITATSAGVSASLDTLTTLITTNGDSDLDNVTLADGYAGQEKVFAVIAEGNAADTIKITPTNLNGGTQITFSANPVGEGCKMIFDGANWNIIGNNGGTIA